MRSVPCLVSMAFASKPKKWSKPPRSGHEPVGPTNTVPKPSIAQVRWLVQMISSNKAKLIIYCDLNQLDEQLEEAERQKDREMLAALNAKADNLERQISPEYTKVMDSLEIIDPNSAEGKQFAALIGTLTKQCK